MGALTNVLVGWHNGVTIITERQLLRFDPQNQNGINAPAFISHAHGDHLRRLSPKVQNYLTPETLDIARIKINCENITPIYLGRTIRLDEFEILAHNAGHMLGSAQFEIHVPDFTVVYTGDINCRNMFTTTAAENITCDILVLETTYGVPFYAFPDLTQTAADIVGWALGEIKAGKIPVFKVYSGGKAQEIVKIFNAMTKIPVVVEDEVASITDAYIKNGVSLEYIRSTEAEAQELLRSGECICLSSTSDSLKNLTNASIAVATGWALGKQFQGANATFPLSGHADFIQLVEYVKLAKPKEVLTVHGFKTEFADYIRRKVGIKARPIPPMNQKLLRDYL
ncbi:MBL fold metallo-hydrolase [Candidatus Bathyarchaeota archaeon]|nr:MBL fold metallo-hydrolase [Candidatus Bathyarchaeota archaeon]